MLVTLVPLFDENMVVQAYSLFTQRDHYMSHPELEEAGKYVKEQGDDVVEGLEIIDHVGAYTLVENKDIFVTLRDRACLSVLGQEHEISPERVVFIIDHTFPLEKEYLDTLRELKKEGYRLAVRKLEIDQYQKYQQILRLTDYLIMDHKKINISSARLFFAKMFPYIKLCAGNLDSRDTFEKLKKEGGYQFYEGPFYRTPITEGQHEVKPLKINYVKLMGMVNKADYDLQKAAEVIARDTSLAIELLKVVKHMARNAEIGSIRHAAAMLGQKELRRWINTVVIGMMYSDKPNEITKLSLIRAKFAENLAPEFQMASQSSELFLMGLFSVVDLIMEMPMEEALDSLKISKEIKEALIEKKGRFAPVYELILAHGNADWEKVEAMTVEHKLETEQVYQAYLDALKWYRSLIRRTRE